MAGYAGYSNKTNTVSATVPMFVITGAAAGRLKVYQHIVGSDATPADVAAKMAFQRTSARGTQSTTVAPNPLDPADPATARAVYDTAWSGNPTITALSTLLQYAMVGRSSLIWTAAPGKELVVPATAGAGLALVSVVATTAQNFAWTTFWDE